MSSEGHILEPPELLSTKSLLSRTGECYYVPYLQRHYSWDEENISRYFESIVHGVRSMAGVEHDSYKQNDESFMGSVVCFVDSRYSSVYPLEQNDVPAKVYVLIDGQQRVSVSLVSSIVLHRRLRKIVDSLAEHRNKLIELDGNIFQDDLTRIFSEFDVLVEETQSDLCELVRSKAAGDKKYYPRMIRSIEDCWSRNRKDCKYDSPIARMLSDFIDFENKINEPSYEMDFLCYDEISADTIYEYVEWLSIATEKMDGSDKFPFGPLPDIEPIFKDEQMQFAFFNRKGTLDPFTPIHQLIQKQQDDNKTVTGLKALHSSFTQAARILTFIAYLLNRVKFVRIATDSEKHAYQIFDSLNTTGAPLTAFETLRPEVIRKFGGVEKLTGTTVSDLLQGVDYHLNVEKRYKDKKTKDLIVSLALAEDGRKLSMDLSEQRFYLLKQYNNSRNNENERSGEEFIRNFLHVTEINEEYISKVSQSAHVSDNAFLSHLTKTGLNHDHKKFAQEAAFCFSLLSSSKHRITIPIISQFYSSYLEEKCDERHLQLCHAIRATASFYAIWRVSRDGTDNIDAHHRRIMRNANTGTVPQLNYARLERKGTPPDIEDLRKEYLRLLIGNETLPLDRIELTDSPTNCLLDQAWINHSVDIPIYETQKSVAKFLLLLHGYWEDYKNNRNPGVTIIDSDLWNHVAHATIDHIIPQKHPITVGSSGKMPRTPKQWLDSIGNLTLLPRSLNSYIKDSDWQKRRLIFIALTSDMKADQKEKEITKALKEQYQLSDIKIKKLIDIFSDIVRLYRGGYIPTIKDLIENKEIDEVIIKTRGEEILKSSWEPLMHLLFGMSYEEYKSRYC